MATDVRKAKEWYRGQQEGLEERFAQAIEESILKVLQMPTAYSVRYRNIRIAHPKIFPYNIHFYIVEDKKLVVFTGVIFNGRQNALHLSR